MYNMSTHTVALDDEAYHRLNEFREKGESFSDVVKRLTQPRKHLADFAGAWGALSTEQFEEIEQARLRRKEIGRARTRHLLVKEGI